MTDRLTPERGFIETCRSEWRYLSSQGGQTCRCSFQTEWPHCTLCDSNEKQQGLDAVIRCSCYDKCGNWRAPDLQWLKDQLGVVFPRVDYAALDPFDIDDTVLRICRIEDICNVDQDRKAKLLARAILRARLPRRARQWLGK